MLLFLEILGLLENLSYRSKRYSVFHSLLYHSLPCSLIHLCFFVFVTLHSVCLPGASLSVGEDGGMETVHNLSNESLNLELVEHLLLTILRIDDLVKFEGLPHYL